MKRRVVAVREELGLRRYLRGIDVEYPPWFSLNALRKYVCIATGGCSWGKPHIDDLFKCRVVRCWKCGSIWSNWE